jgi:quercetin dioxygenase-like cupin family protein
MNKLNLLTEQLTDISAISDDSPNGMREYSLEQGTAFSFALKHNEHVAVVQSWLSADAIFPWHNHTNSQEVLVVYSGEVTIITEEGRKCLKPGDSFHIEVGSGHMLHAKTEVKIIAITIPPDAVAMPKIMGNGR